MHVKSFNRYLKIDNDAAATISIGSTFQQSMQLFPNELAKVMLSIKFLYKYESMTPGGCRIGQFKHFGEFKSTRLFLILKYITRSILIRLASKESIPRMKWRSGYEKEEKSFLVK